MNVIAIDTSATSDAVVAVFHELSAAPPEGWTPVHFKTPTELIRNLHGVGADVIEKLEIVSEGSPINLDGLNYQPITNDVNMVEFGTELRTVPGFSSESIVYLSGCNTGCAQRGISRAEFIAQNLANAASCRVRGARGYLSGYHARGNEECFKDVTGAYAEEYTWSVNATGKKCWSTFKPK